MLFILAVSIGIGEELSIPASTHLQAYRIDRTEVTIEDFETFENTGGYTRSSLWSAEGLKWLKDHPNGAGRTRRTSNRPPQHPIVAVSFFEAEAYCSWKGGSLPSNAEWTQAVCSEGRFPWGETMNVPAAWFTGGKYGLIEQVRTQQADVQSPEMDGPFGVVHGAGNVWEWTVDNPSKGEWRTLRGGSYANLPSYCSCQHQEWARPEETRLTAGFRCVYR